MQREPDYLERAETYAQKLATGKQGGKFAYMNVALRGLALVFSEELEKRDREIARLNSKIFALTERGPE